MLAFSGVFEDHAMPEWKCEGVRLSLFSTGGVRLTAQDWTNLTRQDEAEHEQKGSGRHVFASGLMGGQLSLSVIGNRCDCILSPVINAETISEGNIPSVGDWPDCFRDFQNATEAYLQRFGVPVNRMAFGATLVSVHESRLDAYRVLAEQVRSLNQAPDQLHDVLFRINWPRNSQVDNTLTLNRLTTWQVQQVQQLQVVMGDGNASASFNPLSFVTRLEMDHNTDQAHIAPFDETHLVPIYRELANLALQNAEQGEVQ
jgi:hypothetical protein